MKISKDRLRQLIKEEVSRTFPYILEAEAAEQEKPAHLSDSQWAAIQRERKFAKTGNMEDLIPPEEEPEEEEPEAPEGEQEDKPAEKPAEKPKGGEGEAKEEKVPATHFIKIHALEIPGMVPLTISVRVVDVELGKATDDPTPANMDFAKLATWVREMSDKYSGEGQHARVSISDDVEKEMKSKIVAALK